MQRQGLTSTQIQQLRKTYGPNSIKETRHFSPIRLFLSQFLSPLIYILLFAVILTLVAGEYVDAIIILITVLVNVALGFFQEYKAQSALAELSKVLSHTTNVIRDGKHKKIDVEELLPSDIVLLETGDQVPADCVILESHNLLLIEAILTGESLPVSKQAHANAEGFDQIVPPQDKHAKHVVYMGTTVAEGNATCKVVNIGKNTQMGMIADELSETQEPLTPLQRKLQKLSRTLATIVLIAATIIFVYGIANNQPWMEMFHLAVALAVSAIPEGLLISLTVILSLGMQKILRQKALVRRMVAAETLGSVTTICTDKTGTLTMGHLRLLTAHTKFSRKMKNIGMMLTSKSDVLEVAVHTWASTFDIPIPVIVDELPFHSDKKYGLKLTEDELIAIGAPEVLMHFLGDVVETKKIREEFSRFAEKGYRLVGVASRPRNKNENSLKTLKPSGMKWIGFYVFSDPVRLDVKKALTKVLAAHIQIKVITGDHALTAKSVMSELGLVVSEGEIMMGHELSQLNESQLRDRIKRTKLFARTTPAEKLIIVKMLQQMGEVVAMTGDGVNDAPALKQADIGIVVSTASDVSKSTADIVLLDDNFTTIVNTVEEGRSMYENLKKVILYLLANAFTESLLVLGTLFLGVPLAISAIQVLWINLVTDSLPSITLTVEPKEKGLLRKIPRDRNGSLFDEEMLVLIAVISLLTGLGSLGIYMLFLPIYTIIHVQTLTFSLVATMSLLYTFSCRSLFKPFWQIPLRSNPLLVVAVGFGFFMQLLVVYVPFLQKIFQTQALMLIDWIVIGLLCGVLLGLIETVKWIFGVRMKMRA